MLIALSVISTTLVGLMVGVEFAVAFIVPHNLRSLPVREYLIARADGARMMGRLMPFWYFSSLAFTIVLAVFTWGTSVATLTLTAGALLVMSVIMSVALLVPINNRSAGWTAENHPADWRDQLRRWDRLHIVRVALILSAFVLVAVATAVL
ncbi:MAG: anthrone oxygenase family protein [Brevibacterium sp.]|uniref:DUF1772 domain-containing protein n=1 Tax=Brevibacterium aurantiacum TaxID=273384 RepID=A0A2A3Z9J6_BREAU|nr:DUF1772 domain-containing protein [Brevibacterium aurantiacum]PCC48310.1 hypothetical protein CIK64_01000 [Brevibacterium aurantiacum]